MPDEEKEHQENSPKNSGGKPEEQKPITSEKVEAAVHLIVEEVKKKETVKAVEERAQISLEEQKEFQRFSLLFRFQHILLFSSCIILIITGLPIKFAHSGWAEAYFHLTGGIAFSRLFHRIGASVLIFVGVFHMFYLAFTADGRKNFFSFLPKIKDVTDVFDNLMYFFGFRKEGAKFARFSYLEKFDYWAVYWGMVVMILSGLILWFENQSLALLPKYFLDMAMEAHSDEALLATLAIIIWHFYNVHFNPEKFPMSWTWLTGKISREEMLKHHPLEYENLLKERKLQELQKALEGKEELDVKKDKPSGENLGGIEEKG